MSEISRLLAAMEQGDPVAADRLWPLVYGELRKLAAAQMAHERPGHTLDATALVHEAYMRLVGRQNPTESPKPPRANVPGTGLRFADHRHFVAAAAEAMRRILVDHARKKKSKKRGGGGKKFELSESDRIQPPDADTLLCIDEALAALAEEDAPSADVARLRLFAGLSIEEAGEVLGVSRATAFRDWSYARAFLAAALKGDNSSRNS